MLTANQQGYISNNIHTVTIIVNTIACYCLIKYGFSLLTVKFVTSLIFVVRPIFLALYVRSYFKIDYKVKYKTEPIKQKWNGVAQHIAAVVMESTDLVVLTIFSTLSNVSIYSIYNLVVFGVKQLFLSATTGIQSFVGDLIAKKETEKLNHYFSWIEWAIHTGATYIFGMTGVLIVPFIQVYTQGVTDANYTQTAFALFFVMANASHCLRLPYNILILAGGHFKQTQHCYIIAALLNITISIALVISYGLVGVAIGTLVALIYQMLWMAKYITTHFINRSYLVFLKQLAVDACIVVTAYVMASFLNMVPTTYVDWVFSAIKCAFILLLISIALNSFFYRKKMARVFHFFKRKFVSQ